MAKKPDKHGETKSQPAEIQKLPREKCTACGMAGVAPMVVARRCSNTVACAKRVRRNNSGIIQGAK